MAPPTPLARLLTPLLRSFEEAGIRYCVLRGYADLPHETRNDVDIAVDPASVAEVERLVRRISRETGWLLVSRTAQRGFLRLVVFHPEHPGGVLPLDLCSEHSVWGMVYADADVVLDQTREYAGMRVARPGCEAAVSLGKALLRHGVVKRREDHRRRLVECVARDADGFRACAAPRLGPELCDRLVHAVAEARFDEVESLSGAVRRTLARKTGVLRVGWQALGSSLRTRLWRLSRRGGLDFRGGLFLCLLGPDGSGKTTFSVAIEERLGPLFARVEQHHSLAGVLPRLGGLKKLYYGLRRAPVPPSPLKGVAQPGVVAKPLPAIRTSTYIVYYGLEYVLYRLIVRRRLRRNHLVIFDRYFYDYYLMRLHLNAPRWLLAIFSRLIAQPDALLVMLADPEVIYRRKPELTPEEIQRQQEILKRLDLPRAAHVDTSVSIERTLEKALDVIGPRLLSEPVPGAERATPPLR